MKSLVRTEKGTFKVKSTLSPEIEFIPKSTSPIVSAVNIPEFLKPKKPTKTNFSNKNSGLSKKSLLAAMLKAGGRDLSTQQFAVLLAPCIKKSKDLEGHHKWDLAHSHVRGLARQLEKEGKIKIRKDPKSKQLRYLYSVNEE